MKMGNYRVRKSYLLLTVACVAAAITAYLVVPGGAPSGQGRPSAAVSSSPVDITARYELPGIIGQGWWQQLPAPIFSLKTPIGDNCDQMWRWAHDHGGIDRGWSNVVVSIRARKPVHIDVLAVGSHLLTTRTPSQPNTLLCVPTNEPYMDGEYVLDHGMEPGFLVDHDGASDDFSASSGVGEVADLDFGEIKKISFSAFAHACDCTWQVTVKIVVNGVEQHVTIDDSDSNHPFRTVAAPLKPGDPGANTIWCAADGHGRLTSPQKRDCPIPVVYETPLY